MTKGRSRLTWLALLLCTGLALAVCAEDAREVTLRLKNGDRLTGKVLSEDDQRIVLSTPWNVAIFVPKSTVEEQIPIAPPVQPGPEAAPSAVADVVSPSGKAGEAAASGPEPPAAPPKVAEAPKPAPAAAPRKKTQHWKWNLKLGTDFIAGAKDRSIYYGQTTLTYLRNYEQNPKQFLRNKIDYRVDYGETDGTVSANRMVGANKLDFDVGSGYYGYAALGGGYDRVRKIDFQYELGPGLGYHLLAEKTMVVDVEMGFNYQYRRGLSGAPDREVVQGRLGQELTWEVLPKITFTEQVSFLPFLDDLGEYQLRAEGSLGFGIVQHLSLNLSVLNLYDTLPAPGVPNNELQFRSSLGVTF